MNTAAAAPALDALPSADGSIIAPQPRTEADRCGFQLGWDHARHGLVPPAELLFDGTAVGQGWIAGKAVFGRRKLPTTPALRAWLNLRTQAWQQRVPFDGTSVTPKWLASIAVDHCPVTRQPLGGAPGSDTAPVTVRLDTNAGFEAGNLAVLSQRAAAAVAGLDLRRVLRTAACAGTSAVEPAGIDTTAPGLTADQTARLAALLSQRTRLPYCDAVRVPLRTLPPPAVQPVNPSQRLQLLLTLQFATPGWSTRLRVLAQALPVDARGQADAALRHDFNLFIGAMAPRLLGVGSSLGSTPLEDAWADLRVQRRWQQFAAALGEARIAPLLDRITPRTGFRPVGSSGSSQRHRAGCGLQHGRQTRGADASRSGAAPGRSAPGCSMGRPPLAPHGT